MNNHRGRRVVGHVLGWKGRATKLNYPSGPRSLCVEGGKLTFVPGSERVPEDVIEAFLEPVRALVCVGRVRGLFVLECV